MASLASAIGEPARTRMLFCLMEGPARTGTDWASSQASPAHRQRSPSRLKDEHLVTVFVQGRHRYYSSPAPAVARALERLSVLAGGPRRRLFPSRRNSPRRTFRYDHMAGAVAVSLHDHFVAARWLQPTRASAPEAMLTNSRPKEPALCRARSRSRSARAHVAASLMVVSIGASAGPTWADPWAPHFSLSP